ncbi:MAG TPA: putative baseplate assembly protein [Polyangiaceae bacterium]|jgi:hypothetical protein|nr:putative baseplate assembly protein [Polyangiaceae bacterium]
MSAPSPDFKPHVPPQPAGSENCGCCDGLHTETPRGLDNRDGLSQIAYRVGEYADFRASLQAALSAKDFSKLSELRTRDEDDFTIALLDAFACTADVITFYQERIANESYLRTAVERISLQEMGKLIGYRLRPGVAAETPLAFALETPPKPPPTLAPDPGNFVTGVQPSVSLAPGLKVQSVPGPGETPQTFETLEALADARPTWNAMRPWLSEAVTLKRGDTFTYLKGVRNNLKPGDALVFLDANFDPNRNDWDFRLIAGVTPEPDADRTRVTWQRGLGSIAPFSDPARAPVAKVLRKRAAVFGHNAPAFPSLSLEFRSAYLGRAANNEPDWPPQRFVVSGASSRSNGGFVDLDSVLPEVRAGGLAVLAKGGFDYPSEPAPPGTYVELYRIDSVTEVSRADFGLSAKISRLELRGQNYALFREFVRETTVFVGSEALDFAEHPVGGAVSGDLVPVAVSSEGLLPGRTLIVRGVSAKDGTSVVQVATLVSVRAIDDGRCELRIAPALSAPLLRESVVVHANVALASHGESVSQILGSGDAGALFQRFALKQLPLTYRAAPTELGVASELVVRVGDVAWHERATLFGAPPTERSYTLTTDEQGRKFVAFGDGVRGARLPSGSNNVRASYRKGIGEAGNVKPDRLTQLMSRPLGVKSVSNPLAAEGGTDPESAEAARQSMPLTARTLGRAVSVLDYEDFARAFSGVAKAQASVLALPSGPTIAITLAGPGGAVLTPASPVWQNLLLALRASGDPHVAVQLLSNPASAFRLGIRVKRDPDREPRSVLDAVEAALRARYSFDAQSFGQPVHESEVIAVAQAVPGVSAVDLTLLYREAPLSVPANPKKQIRLLAARAHVQNGVARPAELLTLAEGPLDSLEEMS